MTVMARLVIAVTHARKVAQDRFVQHRLDLLVQRHHL